MSSPITVYVPRDASAISLGADRVARAIVAEAAARNIEVRLVRNGSRGLFWLEPLVEVATAAGRVAYASVKARDVAGLFDADFLDGGEHPLALGLTEEIDYLKRQQRLTFARAGITDPLSLADYIAHGGYRGLRRALEIGSEAIIAEVLDSGLRGRGGAAFPTGIKWRTVAGCTAAQKYIVCNADEGDSGTFSDRMVMEDDPFVLIEGMTIAGLAVGATMGYIYLRSEYPHAEAVLNLHFTSHWLYRVFQEHLKDFDISNEQYNVLRILRGNRESTYNLCEVQERMLNRTANATRLVEKLRKRGLVSRRTSEEDRRRVDIAITEEGLDLLAEMDLPVQEIERRTAQALTNEEARTLTRLLEQLRARLDTSGLS